MWSLFHRPDGQFHLATGRLGGAQAISWQLEQYLVIYSMSSFMLGHQKYCVASTFILTVPVCSLWRSSKSVALRVEGIITLPYNTHPCSTVSSGLRKE